MKISFRYRFVLVAGMVLAGMMLVGLARGATLRPFTTLAAPVVRLRDLFHGAGSDAGRVLGPAPAPGTRISVPARQLAAIAREYGVAWRPSTGFESAVLVRPGEPLARRAVLAALRPALLGLGATADGTVTLDGFTAPMLPVGARPRIVVEQLSYDPNRGGFQGVLAISVAGDPAVVVPVAGRSVRLVSLPVAAHRLVRGMALGPSDLVVRRVAAPEAGAAVVRHAAEALGQGVRRAVPEGAPVPVDDLVVLPTVARGQLVRMEIEAPGLTVTATGVALADAGTGERVDVLNPASRRVVRASVLGPGLVAVAMLMALMALGGCASLQRISEIGGPPRMSPSADPTRAAGWRPMTMPMPRARIARPSPDALWRPGSRAFFRDQRAARVGDLVTVVVNINSSANLQNGTTATRASNQSVGIPNVLGLETQLPHIFSGLNPASALSTTSASANTGAAQIKRSEGVSLRLAGVVTQVLPNGNLVISGSQEVRVGSELRKLSVSGVARPEDIDSNNTISLERMAEARLSYGGRGQLTDVQSPPWGQQLLNILMPF